MKEIKYPSTASWDELIKRPVFDSETLEETVKEIMLEVKEKGDGALKAFNQKFDKVETPSIQYDLSTSDFEVSDELKTAIKQAAANIETFHLAQQEK